MANGAVLMVEILLNTRTGAPTAPNYSARDDASVDARSAASAPQAQAGLPNATTFVQQLIPVLAPDVLLAAQQNRDVDRVRNIDPRQARPSDDQPQTDEAQDDRVVPTAFDAPLSAQPPAATTAEIIPLRSRPSAFAFGATPTEPPISPPNGAQFYRANQAYVQAGASDGRSFAASGLDAASRQTLTRPIDLII